MYSQSKDDDRKFNGFCFFVEVLLRIINKMQSNKESDNGTLFGSSDRDHSCHAIK